jgi:hypothetical protein
MIVRQPLKTIVRISWVDFVRFGGIMYLNTHTGEPYGSSRHRALTDDDLGPTYGVVRRRIYDTVHALPYEQQDGDAAFLPVGTPVYEVRGHPPTLRLAAYQEHPDLRVLCLYEADTSSAEVNSAPSQDAD